MEDYNLSYDDDMILPDGFDPNAETYDPNAEVSSTTEEVPTTEQPVAETEVVAEQAEEQTELTTTLDEMPVAPTVRVKYNHEDRELSLDEATVYAQKGLNYDKLDEKVKSYEAKNAKSEYLAKQLGYANADEMIEAAAQNYRNRQIRELEEAGNTRAMAEFLVDQRLKAMPEPQVAQQPEEPAPQEQQANVIQNLSPERKAELDEFVKLYPGIVKLPPEVLKANANGIRLSVAYEQFKSKAAQKELAIIKQNQASAAKAPITGTVGKAAPAVEEPDDPFMKGFDSDDY